MIKIDDVYKRKLEKIEDFQFDNSVAEAFDNMADRSIPFYAELQRMIVELSGNFIKKGSCVYDLGCSTGNTLSLLMENWKDTEVRFIGIDNSEAMLQQAENKLRDVSSKLFDNICSLRKEDLNNSITEINQASVVLLNWTLQFIKPANRRNLIQNIYRGLLANGCLILCEKIIHSDPLINKIFIDLYYNFKRLNKYSELEIAQKRQALENILIPYSVDQNLRLLKQGGFRRIDIFFRWYNWVGFIAIK